MGLVVLFTLFFAVVVAVGSGVQKGLSEPPRARSARRVEVSVGSGLQKGVGFNPMKYYIGVGAVLVLLLILNLVSRSTEKSLPEGWTEGDVQRAKAKKEREDEYMLDLIKAAEYLKKQGR